MSTRDSHRANQAIVALLLITAISSLALVGCSSKTAKTTATDSDFRALPIVSQKSGDSHALLDPGVFLINSRNDLTAMGLIDDFGQTNFARQSLIVLALGERPTGGYSARIVGVQQAPEGVYVQGIAYAPSPESANTMAITHPYDAVVVPKVVGTVYSEIESQVTPAQ